MEKRHTLQQQCWENWAAKYKTMKLEHFLTPYIKINSKWIKDTNVRPKAAKLLEENTGRTLFDRNHSKILFDLITSQSNENKNKSKWDLNKLKIFCTAKETINKVKDSPQDGGNNCK